MKLFSYIIENKCNYIFLVAYEKYMMLQKKFDGIGKLFLQTGTFC